MTFLSRRTVSTILISGTLLSAPSASAQDQADRASKDPMLLIDRDGLMVRGHFQAGVNGVVEQNLFWNFANLTSPTFDSDTGWLEGYIKPGISFTLDLGNTAVLYGKGSIVASGTLGKDAYDTGNTGAVTLEEGYLGLRAGGQGGPSVNISLGPREFKAGTGMLLANGGSSGFDRGALKLGPRKAWEMAALASVGLDDFTGTAFYLDANEQPDNDSGTKLAGLDLRYDRTAQTFLGATFGHVLESSSPYPKAAPNGIGVPEILPGAREGLNFVNLYGRGNPFDIDNENFFLGGDIAYEWNERIDQSAWAGRGQIGYTFADVGWTPTISYTYQTFSGDDPSTPGLERFDPLFYEGSPSAWATGSKSSMVFINSNVNAHQVALSVKPTPLDTITLRYAHISANELRSPIQFGQGTRVELSGGVPVPVAGVTNAHLSDDIFLEYNRLLSPNAFLTAGLSVSFPGEGIRSVNQANAPIWTGGFVNVVVNY